MSPRHFSWLGIGAAVVGLLAPACGKSSSGDDDSNEAGAGAHGGSAGKGGTGGAAGALTTTGGAAGASARGGTGGGGLGGAPGAGGTSGSLTAGRGGVAGSSFGGSGGSAGSSSGRGGSAGSSSGRGGSNTGGMAGEGGAGPGPNLGSGVICLDDHAGVANAWAANLSTYRSTIIGAGYTLVPVPTFTEDALGDCAAVIVNMPFAFAFSSDEIAAVVSFVGAGGGAFIIGEAGSGGDLASINQLAATWGVSFASLEEAALGELVLGFANHPVTAGLYSIGVDYYRQITLSAGGTDLINGTPNVLAAIDGSSGSGNLVFLGDETMWFNVGAGGDYNVTSLDNARLLTNVIEYIAGPPPI